MEFLQLLLLHDVEAVESLELPERETWVIKNKKKKLLELNSILSLRACSLAPTSSSTAVHVL
jgi:hypothetical protein